MSPEPHAPTHLSRCSDVFPPRVTLLGNRTRMQWECATRYNVGWGNTPAEAYGRWVTGMTLGKLW